MQNLSRDGLSIEQLEDILQKHGKDFPIERRIQLIDELIEMKASKAVPPPDPLIAATTNAVAFTFDFASMRTGDVRNFGDWSKQYREGIDAISSVLQFLEAQEHMDLFATNRAAQQLYQAIIRRGIEIVILNKE